MLATQTSSTASAALPALREELLVHTAPRLHDGSPSWTLEDPGRNVFFQIGWVEAEMLARWSFGDAERIAQAIGRETPLTANAADVDELARFLAANELTQSYGKPAQARLQQSAQARRAGSWLRKALHHYLFFRIALAHPDAFLKRTLPAIRRIFINRRFAWLTAIAGAVGLLLAVRQWSAFIHTFLHFFTLEGAAVAALTLAVSKLAHEAGHAYVARHHGCRVASVGVAFMVMWPVLYTDTSAAWRLPRRRPRLAIAAAGMGAELAIAAWALFAWSLLPDGMLRSAAFMLATTTIVLTLAVNLNPLMRFDGYYLLSDLLNVPNLQHRAFALGRWRLREWLFALGDEQPETFATWRETALIVYAFCVWVYRFFLFLGIALLVYHMAFKLLGMLLMAVEVVVFVARPIVAELRLWFERLRRNGSSPAHRLNRLNRRSRTTLALMLVISLLAALPWRTRVAVPALLHAEKQARLLAPVGARVDRIHVQAGQAVRAGTPLFSLRSPELEHEMTLLRQRIGVLEWQSAFQAMQADTANNAPVARSELQAARSRHALLRRQHEQLAMVAAFDGVVADLATPLAAGEWVATGEWLGTLAAPQRFVVEAYVGEADVGRLRAGDNARFLAEDVSLGALPLRVVDIAATATRRLAGSPELVSANGGGIAASPAAVLAGETPVDGRLWVPEQAVYRVRLAPATSGEALRRLQVLRGTVLIDGAAESPLWRAAHVAAALLIRESGF